jgi:Zn finger protein HypA/HybF involved in hydrogenase expression
MKTVLGPVSTCKCGNSKFHILDSKETSMRVSHTNKILIYQITKMCCPLCHTAIKSIVSSESIDLEPATPQSPSRFGT